MIRLSCWVGALGCTAGTVPEAAQGEPGLLSMLQPFTRCYEGDAAGDECLKMTAFADATSLLARHFQSWQGVREGSRGEILRLLREGADTVGREGGIARSRAREEARKAEHDCDRLPA